MKRVICLILVLCMGAGLCGCAAEDAQHYSFYYLRSQETIDYGSVHALVAPVDREIAGQDAGINYILRLYLEGPLSSDFVSPFPPGTFLHTTYWEDTVLVVSLSDQFSELTNIQATLACACLFATCRDLTGAEQVCIRSGGKTYTYSGSDFLFVDDAAGK